jgi:beta-galactosidase
MHRIALICALLLVALPGAARSYAQAPGQPVTSQAAHVFTTEGDHFTLDGKPFKVLSGELHYARIPREYWHARLKMAKAMGLNTIATYVFWNVHEPHPGVYDFSGNADLAAFVRAAQEEGLYVILRSGPYSCAEWDLGGFPAWLLADPKSAAVLRSNDPLFMVPAERWIARLAKEVLPLQIGRGGPILMTQIENEYGQFSPFPVDNPHAYIEHLHEIYVKLGFTSSFLYTADNWRHIPEGSIAGLYASVNFGIKNHQGGMDALAKARPGQALFVSEYWPGWFDHWGHPHETRPIAPQLEDIDYILTRGAGINIYMFEGGTSFGFYAGSSFIDGKFLPDVTSYDYDAPLDESGRPTPKYFAYRKLLATYRPCGNESCLPPVPTVAPPITIPTIQLTESSPLWSNLPKPIASALPAPMETFGQNFGYILYRTQLPAAAHGGLAVKDVHDFASVYLDGKLVGSLDRRKAAPDGSLPPLAVTTNGPARLDLLVANDGRVNVDQTMRTETKGITQLVALDGRPLGDWQVYTLPMLTPPKTSVIPDEGRNLRISSSAPTFLTAHFTLAATGDTFLDVSKLGKGAVWINGHNLGRFWNAGPQQTLYVPGPWLKAGSNEIVVFDMLPTQNESVTGLDHPILDAPVANATRSQQE